MSRSLHEKERQLASDLCHAITKCSVDKPNPMLSFYNLLFVLKENPITHIEPQFVSNHFSTCGNQILVVIGTDCAGRYNLTI